RCAAIFEGGPDWSAPTRCAGWSVRDLLSHVDAIEVYHSACLDDALADFFAKGTAAGATDMNSFNDLGVRERADLPVDDVLASWRAANGDVRRRMRERGADGTMASSVGPYPVDLMAFHIASEYATHADDMGAELSDAERAKQLAWREKVSLFALKEMEKPVAIERLTNGSYGVTSGTAKAVLRPDEFVEAVCARLPKDFSIDPALRAALVALA
ncbi:MAG: maleylpyruvate isomerase N-terminal domain-containing protein, partial [Actinomycetota bacterium]